MRFMDTASMPSSSAISMTVAAIFSTDRPGRGSLLGWDRVPQSNSKLVTWLALVFRAGAMCLHTSRAATPP